MNPALPPPRFGSHWGRGSAPPPPAHRGGRRARGASSAVPRRPPRRPRYRPCRRAGRTGARTRARRRRAPRAARRGGGGGWGWCCTARAARPSTRWPQILSMCGDARQVKAPASGTGSGARRDEPGRTRQQAAGQAPGCTGQAHGLGCSAQLGDVAYHCVVARRSHHSHAFVRAAVRLARAHRARVGRPDQLGVHVAAKATALPTVDQLRLGAEPHAPGEALARRSRVRLLQAAAALERQRLHLLDTPGRLVNPAVAAGGVHVTHGDARGPACRRGAAAAQGGKAHCWKARGLRFAEHEATGAARLRPVRRRCAAAGSASRLHGDGASLSERL
eukprot:scaffold15437_cov71-Phaeocystis_antarctica.AAC.5